MRFEIDILACSLRRNGSEERSMALFSTRRRSRIQLRHAEQRLKSGVDIEGRGQTIDVCLEYLDCTRIFLSECSRQDPAHEWKTLFEFALRSLSCLRETRPMIGHENENGPAMIAGRIELLQERQQATVEQRTRRVAVVRVLLEEAEEELLVRRIGGPELLDVGEKGVEGCLIAQTMCIVSVQQGSG